MTERDLAHDTGAEQSLLGALLLDRDAIARVHGMVSAQDFSQGRHRAIFTAITTLFERKEPADLTTVSAELTAANTLDTSGGIAYLSELLLVVPTAVHAEYYAEIVHRHGVRRRLLEAGGQIVRIAHDTDPSNVEQALAQSIQLLTGIEVGIDHDDMVPYATAMPDFLTHLREQRDGIYQRDVIATGWRHLDHYCGGGFERGEYIVLGARPSQGKTAFALQLAHNIARSEFRYDDMRYVAIFSAEMSMRALLYRALAEVTGIETERIKTVSNLTPSQWAAIDELEPMMATMPIVISDKARPTTDQMLQRIDRWEKTHGPVRLVLFDYIELAGDQGGDTEERRLTKVSRGLSRIAKETGATVVALSQLNREVEKRPGCRPQLSDIRHSGTIEQDADRVLFLWRQDYYEERKMLTEIDTAKRGTADVIIAKNREGKVGDFTLRFTPSLTAFSNLEDAPR